MTSRRRPSPTRKLAALDRQIAALQQPLDPATPWHRRRDRQRAYVRAQVLRLRLLAELAEPAEWAMPF